MHFACRACPKMFKLRKNAIKHAVATHGYRVQLDRVYATAKE